MKDITMIDPKKTRLEDFLSSDGHAGFFDEIVAICASWERMELQHLITIDEISSAWRRLEYSSQMNLNEVVRADLISQMRYTMAKVQFERMEQKENIKVNTTITISVLIFHTRFFETMKF